MTLQLKRRDKMNGRLRRLRVVAGVALFVLAAATDAPAGPEAASTRLSAALKPSPNQEFKRPKARGTFRAVYSPSARTLKFRFTASGLSGPVRVAELHIGKITHAGFSGRYPLCQGHYVPCVAGKWITVDQVFPDLILQLTRRGGYVDLHTLRNTAGEAAGKLRVTSG